MSTDREVGSFHNTIDWQLYVAASYAFAAVRQDGIIRNLACRVVLTPFAMPASWGFSDDIGDLVVRRGCLGKDEARALLASAQDRVPLGDTELELGSKDDRYGWTYLRPGPSRQQTVQWRSHVLVGGGGPQRAIISYDEMSRLDARLRVPREDRRLFDGWKNLAVFLGEGGQPLTLADNSHANLEYFAPLTTRFVAERSKLTADGVLSVEVLSLDLTGDHRPQLMLGSTGAGEPRVVPLYRKSPPAIWYGHAKIEPGTTSVPLTLMLGNEVADQLAVIAEPAAVAASTVVASHLSSDMGTKPSKDDTELARLTRRVDNHPLLARLQLLGKIVIGLGALAGALVILRSCVVPTKEPQNLSPPVRTGPISRGTASSLRLYETDFDDGVLDRLWSTTSGTPRFGDPEESYGGFGSCLKIVGPGTLTLVLTRNVPAHALWGKWLLARAQVRSSGISPIAGSSFKAGKFHLAYTDSSGSNHYSSVGDDFFTDRGSVGWGEKRTEAVFIPVGARDINLFVGIQENGGTLWVDDVVVETVTGLTPSR